MDTPKPMFDDEWIGQTVICRSNQDEPLMVGIFRGFQRFPNFSLPLVDFGNNDLKVCLSPMIPYDDDIFKLLNTWTPEKQYDYICKLRWCFSMITRGREQKSPDTE